MTEENIAALKRCIEKQRELYEICLVNFGEHDSITENNLNSLNALADLLETIEGNGVQN